MRVELSRHAALSRGARARGYWTRQPVAGPAESANCCPFGHPVAAPAESANCCPFGHPVPALPLSPPPSTKRSATPSSRRRVSRRTLSLSVGLFIEAMVSRSLPTRALAMTAPAAQHHHRRSESAPRAALPASSTPGRTTALRSEACGEPRPPIATPTARSRLQDSPNPLVASRSRARPSPDSLPRRFGALRR